MALSDGEGQRSFLCRVLCGLTALPPGVQSVLFHPFVGTADPQVKARSRRLPFMLPWSNEPWSFCLISPVALDKGLTISLRHETCAIHDNSPTVMILFSSNESDRVQGLEPSRIGANGFAGTREGSQTAGVVKYSDIIRRWTLLTRASVITVSVGQIPP